MVVKRNWLPSRLFKGRPSQLEEAHR